jgi:hypothetical protein
MSRLLTPFLVCNLAASMLLFLQPLAVPVFFAEFCLLAIWSAWGPGYFWPRFGVCLLIGSILFLSQIYILIVVLVFSKSFGVILVVILCLFSSWIMAQIPLWGLRYIWQWRITRQAAADLRRFSVNDNMIGITMICVALASCRWATDYLIDAYGPFGYERVWTFYGWVLLEFYLLIAFAGMGTWLAFRLDKLASTIIPMLAAGLALAVLTAWLWFAAENRWIATGVLWCGTILFSWSIILSMRYLKRLGFGLFLGSTKIG